VLDSLETVDPESGESFGTILESDVLDEGCKAVLLLRDRRCAMQCAVEGADSAIAADLVVLAIDMRRVAEEGVAAVVQETEVLVTTGLERGSEATGVQDHIRSFEYGRCLCAAPESAMTVAALGGGLQLELVKERVIDHWRVGEAMEVCSQSNAQAADFD
jgi:hypothetical protein